MLTPHPLRRRKRRKVWPREVGSLGQDTMALHDREGKYLTFTLAMIVMDTSPGKDPCQVKIYASDLNTRVLGQAERELILSLGWIPSLLSGGGAFSRKGCGNGRALSR